MIVVKIVLSKHSEANIVQLLPGGKVITAVWQDTPAFWARPQISHIMSSRSILILSVYLFAGLPNDFS